jgi:small subunit ribosomal protein S16
MLAIKLKRVGKKHQASFRVVVSEKRSKMNGRYVEDLGWWNPHTNAFQVNGDAAKKWISQGAQPTESVHNLLVKAKVVEGKKIPQHVKPAKAAEEGK